MCIIGLNPRLADPGTCMNTEANPCDYKYYAYVTTWVDDVTTISDDTGKIVKGIEVNYVLQIISILYEKELIYLGASVRVYKSICIKMYYFLEKLFSKFN